MRTPPYVECVCVCLSVLWERAGAFKVGRGVGIGVNVKNIY